MESRAHTSCLYPNTKEELNTDSVCIHSDPGTRQVSGLYFQSKAQKVPWNIQLWQLFGILLPLWMHHCNKYPEDLPKQSNPWEPSSSYSLNPLHLRREVLRESTGCSCGPTPPTGSGCSGWKPSQATAANSTSQNCCLILSWLWD